MPHRWKLISVVLLLACSDSSITGPTPDPCADLRTCIPNLGLAVRTPEIVWSESRLHWRPGQQIAGPGDTVMLRVRVENYASSASPRGLLAMSNTAGARQYELPSIPADSFHLIEREWVVPEFTFSNADTLKPHVDLESEHGLTGVYIEGASVIPLLGRGFSIRLISAPDSLRVGIPAVARIRLNNPFPLATLPTTRRGCIFDIDFCPVFYGDHPVPAIASGDSVDLDMDVTLPATSFLWWYEQSASYPYYLTQCVRGGERERCAYRQVVLLPNFELTCPSIPLPTTQGTVQSGDPRCSSSGSKPGTLYHFDAVAGTTYRAAVIGDQGGLRFSDENGVAYNAPTRTHEFTATTNERRYLIVLHAQPIAIAMTRAP